MWVVVLFSVARLAPAFNRWTRAQLQRRPARRGRARRARPTTPDRVLIWLGLALLAAAASALAGGVAADVEHDHGDHLDDPAGDVAGLVVAHTPLARFPGAGAMSSALLISVVAVLASQSNFEGIAAAPLYLLCGVTIIAIHAVLLALAARLFHFDLYLCGISSLAHIGGVAATPVLAASYAPALVPVGVLLALLGYILGTGFGLVMATVLSSLAPYECNETDMRARPADHSPLRCSRCATPLQARATASTPRRARQRRDRRRAMRYLDAGLLGRAPGRRRRSRVARSRRDRRAERTPACASIRPCTICAALPATLTRAQVAGMDRRPVAAARRAAVRCDGSNRSPRRRSTPSSPTRNLDADAGHATGPLRPGRASRRAAHASRPTCASSRSAATPTSTGSRKARCSPARRSRSRTQAATATGCSSSARATQHGSTQDAIAEGTADTVLGVRRQTPVSPRHRRQGAHRVHAGGAARVRTAARHGRARAARADGRRRAGQRPARLHLLAVWLPVRDATARCLRHRRCCRGTPTRAPAPLPLTRANLIRQAFKFLGERYGWGHDYNARDCSGFVSEVYRSMGVLMPRNTSDQARSPALRPHPLRHDATAPKRARPPWPRCRSATWSTSPAT